MILIVSDHIKKINCTKLAGIDTDCSLILVEADICLRLPMYTFFITLQIVNWKKVLETENRMEELQLRPKVAFQFEFRCGWSSSCKDSHKVSGVSAVCKTSTLKAWWTSSLTIVPKRRLISAVVNPMCIVPSPTWEWFTDRLTVWPMYIHSLQRNRSKGRHFWAWSTNPKFIDSQKPQISNETVSAAQTRTYIHRQIHRITK